MVSMEGGIHGFTPYRGSAAISKEKPGVYITEWVQLRRLCIKKKFKMLVGASHSVIGESPSGNSRLLENGLSVLKNHEDCSWRWLRLDELERLDELGEILAKIGIPRDCQLQADKNHSGQRWAKTRHPMATRKSQVYPIPLVDIAAKTGLDDHDVMRTFREPH